MSLGDKRISSTLVTIELLPNGSGPISSARIRARSLKAPHGPQMREAGMAASAGASGQGIGAVASCAAEGERKPRISRARRSHSRAIVEKLRRRSDVGHAVGRALRYHLTAVAQHLQVLEDSGLVHTEKLGRVRTCRIEPAGFHTARTGLTTAVDVGSQVGTDLEAICWPNLKLSTSKVTGDQCSDIRQKKSVVLIVR